MKYLQVQKANEPVGSLEFKELLYPDSKGNLSFNVDFIKVREKFRGKGMSSLLYEEMFKQTKEIGEEKKSWRKNSRRKDNGRSCGASWI